MSRKLDAAIAEALGTKFVVAFRCPSGERIMGCPLYSTDGNAMLELDREMREREFELRVDNYGRVYATNYYNLQTEEWVGFVAENTMPLAVAKSAYKALKGKEWGK